jgi:hypothetical protein
MGSTSKGEWHKSSRSDAGDCVEVRQGDGEVQVRDTKDRAGAVLTFTPREWSAFLAGVRLGEFDMHE